MVKRILRASLLTPTLSILLMLGIGCGFHLRGAFTIPESLKILHLLPNQPFEPFQHALGQILTSNGVNIVRLQDSVKPMYATLTLSNQAFSERTIAYGSDGQANRSVLQYKVMYQLVDCHGNTVVSNGKVQVERELTLNPNAVLGTDNQRKRLMSDLYLDAASQLARQFSHAHPE